MKVPITAGIYTDSEGAIRVAYPVNMTWVPPQDGIDDGHLRPADGIEAFATGEGADRGALVLPADHAVGGGTHFRVSGTKLVTVSSSGVVASLGDIPGSDLARLDFSFDRIGIAANGDLYYWDGITLTQVTDPDVGVVNDMIWIDGYFMVTDGQFIAVTELADPTSVLTTKYEGTDIPDPIQCLLKANKQAHVVSRHAIDVFQNVGGSGFPFKLAQSAHIAKGAIGERAACVFNDAIAFVGGGRNASGSDAPGVWLGRNAETIKLSSREIDKLLLEYSEADLATVTLETVVDVGSQFLFVHLPDRTLVYVADAPAAAGTPAWCTLTTAIAGFSKYRARNIVRAAGSWIVGDPSSSAIGRWTQSSSQHYGQDVRWEFSTPMLYNNGRGAIVKELELVALTGFGPEGRDSTVATAYSTDGRKWSPDRTIPVGQRGDTERRLRWFNQGPIRNRRIQRFTGDSGSRLTAQHAEAQFEDLIY